MSWITQEDHQGQGFPYTGNTAKQMNGHRIVFRNLGGDLSFDGEDLLVDGIHQCPIHLHTGADHRVSEARAYCGAVGPPVNPFLEVREVGLKCWCSGYASEALHVDEQGTTCA